MKREEMKRLKENEKALKLIIKNNSKLGSSSQCVGINFSEN